MLARESLFYGGTTAFKASNGVRGDSSVVCGGLRFVVEGGVGDNNPPPSRAKGKFPFAGKVLTKNGTLLPYMLSDTCFVPNVAIDPRSASFGEFFRRA